MEETKAPDTNTKTQLSLAAALFFSPLVQNMLDKNNRDITEKDRQFIRGYIKFGYITLLFWVITIAAGVLNYLFALNILSVTYTISIFILIWLLIISVVSILSDISLVRWEGHLLQTYTIEGNKKDIILKYLPIYNIYLRYKEHSFDKPNRWIKESILWRLLFLTFCMMGNVMISSSILIIIILRVASLMSDIDVLNHKTKQYLNTLFFKNPEELWGYVTGFLIYLGKSFVHLFTKMEVYTLRNEVIQEKERYSHIIDIQNNIKLIIEYIIWTIILIWLIYFIKPDFTVRTYYAGLGLLIARYLTMAIQLKHLPHLPIAREIMTLVLGIGLLFKKKSAMYNS